MTRRRARKGRRRLFARAAIALVVVVGVLLAIKIATWPNVAALARENPKSTAFIERYENQRKRDSKKPALRWRWASWNAISPNLKRAAIVAEDAEFFFHEGFSEREIKAAIEKAVEKKEIPRGASTITQQLAKNLWLSPSRNPLRKVEEAILTRQLEKELTKRRILELYLNVVEFGPGIYGAEAASRAYFGKSAASLSVREAASLAAGLPKPSAWHPGSKSRYYARRTSRIERMVAKAGFLGRYVGGPTGTEVAALERDRVKDTVSRDAPTPLAAPAPAAKAELSPQAEAIPRIEEAPADTVDLQKLMEELKRDLEELQREESIPEAP